MERLRVLWNYDFYFVVDSRGKSRGLAVLWNTEISCKVVSFSTNHVDLTMAAHSLLWTTRNPQKT